MVRFVFLSTLAFMALAPLASAQSSVSSSGTNNYSLSQDPSSVGGLSDLSFGEDMYTYNLILPYSADRSDPYYAPYTSTTGSATAYAMVDPATYYDSSSMTGFAGIDSGAAVNPPSGTAAASVGSELDLTITNDGADPVTLNASVLVSVLGSASATGTHNASSNFAKVDTYAGFRDYSQTNYQGVNLYYVNFTGDDTSTHTDVVGNWTDLGSGMYQLDYSVTIMPNEIRAFSFWTSSRDTAAVPEPTSMAALGLGALGLLSRRRKV